jgi:hypothetical protein
VIVSMAPTGKIIRGHVLDVGIKPFERAMRFALCDPQLYVKWNPKKMRGWGCWEIRRRPEFNSTLDVGELGGNIYLKVGPKEYDLVHHVLDCAYLNYDVIRTLKEIDTWQYGNASEYQDEVERRTRTRRQRELEAREKDLAYMAQHYRQEINAFKDALRDGVNPHAIAAHWDHVKEVD